MNSDDDDAPIKLALLIDDEDIDQKMYKRIIMRSGLVARLESYLAADHALERLNLDTDEQVDAIFLDINMPRMNGFEFLEAAVERMGPKFTKVCVIMLTTSLNPADRQRAEQFEVVKDFLNKPLTVEHVAHVAALVKAASKNG